MPAPTLRALARFHWSGTATGRSKLHTTASLYIKDSLKDRTKMNTEPTEYSKSGSDSAAAGKDTAFEPTEGKSQDGMGSVEKTQGDPLNVSPGNQDISEPVKSDQGAEKAPSSSAGEQKSSGSGSPSKGKKLS